MEETGKNKAHRSRLSKRKVQKNKLKKERHNPKAFTFSGGVKSVQRRVQRTLDIASKREKAPGIDKSNVEDDSTPPYIVAIQGPPGVGKTTLIRSLVKNYTKYTLNQIDGTITLVSSKNRRLTFIECPNDMHGMIDVAKVADLVLLLIDASFSFEMETFEFLNILQVHGFPRVLGVLTHLDKIEDNRTLRKTKKKMKNRFWTEIYNGAKLFYLSGINNGFYNKTEIRNLSRFIAVQKFENLSWRSSHPYIVSLRTEELEEDSDKDPHSGETSVYFYGFVKGGIMRKNQNIHIPGLGDYIVNGIDEFNDPCPLPETRINKKGTNAGLRVLNARERNIYAPYCDVGSVQMDSNSLYIHIPDNVVNFTRRKVLFEEDDDRDTSAHHERGGGEESDSSVSASEDPDDADVSSDQDINLDEQDEEGQIPEAVSYVRRLQESQSALNEKVNNLSLKLLPSSDCNLENVYDVKGGTEENCLLYEEKSEDSADYYDNLKTKNGDNLLFTGIVGHSLKDFIYGESRRSKSEFKKIMNHFKSNSENSRKDLFENDKSTDLECREIDEDEDECSTDCTDDIVDSYRIDDVYIYPSKPRSIRELQMYWTEEKFSTLKSEKFITGGIDNSDDEFEEAECTGRGDEGDDREETEQTEEETDSKQDEEQVFKIGKYVRIRVDGIDKEWIKAQRGITILGTLLPGESTFGNINVRIKKHRWYPKILKSDDVLTFSIGWRRFQSLPVYSIQDRNETRYRMLKYTPEHMHCYCTTYGPIIPCNFGILAIRSSERTSNFRIAATGVSVEMQAKSDIVKKLKLIGEPKKIYKNTAFIQKMFNSDLEVSKFAGAKIQTVSGIRGQIKKAIGTSGLFRATFEDKVLLSDIVFCKTWISISPRQFYNPVIDLPIWRRLKTQAELRRENNIPIPIKSDSVYVEKQDRPPKRKFNSVPIPASLEKDLPFASKTKNDSKKLKSSGQVAVIRSSFDKRVANLFQRLSTIQKERDTQRVERKKVTRDIKMRRKKPIERMREVKSEERKKRRYALKGANLDKQRRKFMMCE